MVVLALRNIYTIEVPELFIATLIPITAAAEPSSLETHLSSDTVCCYSCLLLLPPFMCLYIHTFLKVIASMKNVSRASEETYLQKQAALCSNMNLHQCRRWTYHNTRFTEVPCYKMTFCLCIYRVSLQHGCQNPRVQVIGLALPSSSDRCVLVPLH